jgi:uncharacterized RDD family membrane protein YckC
MDYEAEDEPGVAGLRPDGSPDPAYAAALGLIAVSPGRRALAFLIDAAIGVLLLVPAVIGALLLLPELLSGDLRLGRMLVPLILYGAGEILFVLYVLVQLVLHGLRGVTVGKLLCGIRSVKATSFERPGFWRIALRALVLTAAYVVVPVIGAVPFLLSPLWDPENRGRGWLDRIGGNWLVDVRAGLDPYDVKSLRRARKRVETAPVEAPAPLPSLATRDGAVSYVPGDRSSSGVVGALRGDVEPADPWAPPVVGPALTATDEAARPAPAHSAEDPVVAVLQFDDGTAYALNGDTLVGRNPEPVDGERMRHVVPVHDALVSKTHLAFGVGADGPWVVDRSSATGTRIRLPDGQSVPASAGVRMPAPWGSSVELGDRRFRILPPGTAGATTTRGDT